MLSIVNFCDARKVPLHSGQMMVNSAWTAEYAIVRARAPQVPHQAQRLVETMTRAGVHHSRAVDGRFGRDHELTAREHFERLADHALSPIGRRGVDEVDAKSNGLFDQPR